MGSLAPGETRAGAKPHSDNLGCFGAGSSSKNGSSNKGNGGRKESQSTSNGPGSSSRPTRTGPVKGMELLWQPEVNILHLLLIEGVKRLKLSPHFMSEYDRDFFFSRWCNLT